MLRKEGLFASAFIEEYDNPVHYSEKLSRDTIYIDVINDFDVAEAKFNKIKKELYSEIKSRNLTKNLIKSFMFGLIFIDVIGLIAMFVNGYLQQGMLSQIEFIVI